MGVVAGAHALAGDLLAVLADDVGEVGLVRRDQATGLADLGEVLDLARSAAGTFADDPVVEFLTISLPLMTASVFSYVAVKSPSKDFCIVSVRM